MYGYVQWHRNKQHTGVVDQTNNDLCVLCQRMTQLMLDPAKLKNGKQPGYKTTSIKRSEVDVLPRGILRDRLHHGSREQVTAAGPVLLAANVMSE